MSTADQIRQACEKIIDHYVSALTPGKAKSEPITSTAIEAPTPLPLRVLNARSMAVIYLASWATVIVGGRRLTWAPDRYDAIGLARFVALHSEWLGNHEAAQSAANQLTAIATELEDVATGVTKPARIPVGPCVDQAPDADTICPGQLIAHMEPPATIICDTNTQHAWPPVRWPNLKIKMSRLDPYAAGDLVARLSGIDLT